MAGMGLCRNPRLTFAASSRSRASAAAAAAASAMAAERSAAAWRESESAGRPDLPRPRAGARSRQRAGQPVRACAPDIFEVFNFLPPAHRARFWNFKSSNF